MEDNQGASENYTWPPKEWKEKDDDEPSLVAATTSPSIPGKSNIRMPSGLPFDLEPPPPTVGDDVEKYKSREAWEHAGGVELEGHRTIDIFELTALPKDRKAATAK